MVLIESAFPTERPSFPEEDAGAADALVVMEPGSSHFETDHHLRSSRSFVSFPRPQHCTVLYYTI